jgi:hypothetical protein
MSQYSSRVYFVIIRSQFTPTVHYVSSENVIPFDGELSRKLSVAEHVLKHTLWRARARISFLSLYTSFLNTESCVLHV